MEPMVSTGMGFGDSEAKRALARIPNSVSASSPEQLIRQALRELASQ